MTHSWSTTCNFMKTNVLFKWVLFMDRLSNATLNSLGRKSYSLIAVLVCYYKAPVCRRYFIWLISHQFQFLTGVFDIVPQTFQLFAFTIACTGKGSLWSWEGLLGSVSGIDIMRLVMHKWSCFKILASKYDYVAWGWGVSQHGTMPW